MGTTTNSGTITISTNTNGMGIDNFGIITNKAGATLNVQNRGTSVGISNDGTMNNSESTAARSASINNYPQGAIKNSAHGIINNNQRGVIMNRYDDTAGHGGIISNDGKINIKAQRGSLLQMPKSDSLGSGPGWICLRMLKAH